jgi:hypothetical protein
MQIHLDKQVYGWQDVSKRGLGLCRVFMLNRAGGWVGVEGQMMYNTSWLVGTDAF